MTLISTYKNQHETWPLSITFHDDVKDYLKPLPWFPVLLTGPDLVNFSLVISPRHMDEGVIEGGIDVGNASEPVGLDWRKSNLNWEIYGGLDIIGNLNPHGNLECTIFPMESPSPGGKVVFHVQSLRCLVLQRTQAPRDRKRSHPPGLVASVEINQQVDRFAEPQPGPWML